MTRTIIAVLLSVLSAGCGERLGMIREKSDRLSLASVLLNCHGKFKHREVTKEQLQEVVKLHTTWLHRAHAERNKHPHERANLCGARLPSAKLNRVDLSWVTLSAADLRNAELIHVNLAHANLPHADLSGAMLLAADLTHANLTYANLKSARLIGANLYKTRLNSANLAYTRFIPLFDNKPATQLPEFRLWQFARNLALVRMGSDTISKFHQLREDFKRNGMRPEERGITAALQRAQTQDMNWLERNFRWIAFDLTSAYGDSPGRPLLILVTLILLLWLPYTVALKMIKPIGRGAIWMVWNEDRLQDISGDEKDKKKREPLLGLPFLKALHYGFWFSLLSAFHFGWRDLNVGNWIARIQPREYVLRGTGWVRVVSGVQSLLSIYLVALSVLTYFGRPFE